MEGADVVLLGETHDDRIAHLLQLQLLRGAQQRFSRQGIKFVQPEIDLVTTKNIT